MGEFELSASTRALWASAGARPASPGEIAEIRALAKTELPSDYVFFLEAYGFASWSDADEVYFKAGQTLADIASMMAPSEIELSTELAADGFFPIAVDQSGHALILLQTTSETGSVWYQYDLDEPVFVSDDFASFVSGLFCAPEAAPTEQWCGTPVLDEATGFTIAAETRQSWADYGTGSTPEPADELETIEKALGRALPEALRTFLTTYGYVTYFGDIPAQFSLPEGANEQTDILSVIYSTTVLGRSLPTTPDTPLAFASTALPEGSLLIGLSPTDDGVIYWQENATSLPVRLANDLRRFLAGLYLERVTNE